MKTQPANVVAFPPITKPMALEIAAQACKLQSLAFTCHEKKPKNCLTYYVETKEPCWFVLGRWNDEPNILRSSRIIVISRLSGKILFDGSASDEG